MVAAACYLFVLVYCCNLLCYCVTFVIRLFFIALCLFCVIVSVVGEACAVAWFVVLLLYLDVLFVV